jgi:hypothetical protein
VAPVVELQVEPKIETAADVEKLQVEEPPKAAEVPRPAPVVAVPDTTAEGSSPSAEELAEALRFLTPSQTPGSQQTLAEAGAALAHELSHRQASGNGNRWVAEAMAPSAEEASGSLEDEMFRTFAASAGGQAQSSGATPANSSASEPAINATQIAAESRRETRSFTPAEESLAAAMAASASASVRAEPQQKDSPTRTGEETPFKEEAAVTFADAVRRDETESVSALGHMVNNWSAEPPAHEEDSISESGSGGQEAMGKETKGKGGKWHQIRSGVPAASDAVEAAKQAEENPKTMAAAASADGADPNSIASIVDSVLADLRPRIVEEIAKKLAKK